MYITFNHNLSLDEALCKELEERNLQYDKHSTETVRIADCIKKKLQYIRSEEQSSMLEEYKLACEKYKKEQEMFRSELEKIKGERMVREDESERQIKELSKNVINQL